MTTVSSTFTAVGVSAALAVAAKGETVSVAISGTYAQTIRLERAVTPDQSAWETIKTWSTANATVAYQHVTDRDNEVLRLHCVSDTSGTSTYSMSDGDMQVKQLTDDQGNTLAVFHQSGAQFPGAVITRGMSCRAQAAPVAKTVTAAITAAELITGLMTTTGATGPSVHQLPTGTLLEAALPAQFAIGDSFEWTLINTGTGASDDATITVNTDVTIVGNPTVGALTDATIIAGSGTFLVKKTAANTFVVYRKA